jgi:hypothetical protein
MAVIKRTECRDCGISAGGVHLRECPRWTTDMRVVYERDTAEVEYVPAEQLRGAVEVLEWLVSMDDPEDVIGRAERQTVTLTKIIERARAALRGQCAAPPRKEQD